MLGDAVNFGKALWSAIQGNGFNFELASLTEGFKATLSEMPKIAERSARGGIEQALGDEATVWAMPTARG